MQQQPTAARRKLDLGALPFAGGDPVVLLLGATEQPVRRHGPMPPKPVLPLSRRLEHELAARLEDVESELKRLRKLKIEHRFLKRALRALGRGRRR